MRVLYFTHYTDLFGANRSLIDLITGLGDFDVESCVISPNKGSICDLLSSMGITTATYPIEMWLSPSYENKSKSFYNWLKRRRSAQYRLARNVKQLKNIHKFIEKCNPDILYTNSSVLPIGWMLSKIYNIPHVWHIREYGGLAYGMGYDWGKWLTRRIINNSDRVICVSNSVADFVSNNKRNDNCYVVYNGVARENIINQNYVEWRSKQKSDKIFTFSLVGLIHRMKAQHEAINAFRCLIDEFPNVNLVIAGKGDLSYEEELHKLVYEYDIKDKVIFLGYVDNPFGVFQQSDAAIVCSRHEAMGRVTAEAMAACLPVIGYNSGGTAEIIKHGVTGYLYNNVSELKEYMALVVRNKNMINTLGFNAYKYALENFTIEKYSSTVYSILTNIKKN